MISRLFIYNWYVICLLINWYQDFYFSIGIVSLLIGIFMHFIDTFLIGIIFVFRPKGGEHPLIDSLCWTKRGEEYVFISFVLFLTPLLMIDKRGRRIWVYMHVCMHVFYVFIKFIWCQSIIYRTCLFLVSKDCKRDH